MNYDPQALQSLFMDAFHRFRSDGVSRFGASIAYYAVFSLVPLLVIAITVAGFFFGKSGAEEQILRDAGAYLGQDGREFIEETVRTTHDRRVGTGATVMSLLLVFLSAAAVFKELKDALNRVFDVPSVRRRLMGFFKKNLLLFGLVLAMGFLLLVSLVLSTLLSFFSVYFNELFSLPPLLWQTLNFLVSFAVTALLFGLLYRFLPDTRLPWRPIIFGALITALLFTLGKSLIGFYLAQSDPASAYGAAGTVILILLWTYYSSQIILFGAELTAVHATRQGYLAYRAEVVQDSAGKNQSRKDFLARIVSAFLFLFLRRLVKRFLRRFRG